MGGWRQCGRVGSGVGGWGAEGVWGGVGWGGVGWGGVNGCGEGGGHMQPHVGAGLPGSLSGCPCCCPNQAAFSFVGGRRAPLIGCLPAASASHPHPTPTPPPPSPPQPSPPLPPTPPTQPASFTPTCHPRVHISCQRRDGEIQRHRPPHAQRQAGLRLPQLPPIGRQHIVGLQQVLVLLQEALCSGVGWGGVCGGTAWLLFTPVRVSHTKHPLQP